MGQKGYRIERTKYTNILGSFLSFFSHYNTVYTHPTSSGNKHIPSGGSAGQILRWSSDGTAVWGSDNNTTYSTGTSSVSGLTKLYTSRGHNTDGTITQDALTTLMDDRFVLYKRNVAVTTDAAGNANVDWSTVAAFPAQSNLKIDYVFTNTGSNTFGRYVHLCEWTSGKVLANGTYYLNLIILPTQGTA